MFCRFCGQQVPDDSTFCIYCGEILIEDMTSDSAIHSAADIDEIFNQAMNIILQGFKKLPEEDKLQIIREISDLVMQSQHYESSTIERDNSPRVVNSDVEKMLAAEYPQYRAVIRQMIQNGSSEEKIRETLKSASMFSDSSSDTKAWVEDLVREYPQREAQIRSAASRGRSEKNIRYWLENEPY